MEIRQLEYFVAVAEMGEFTRVAEVCHIVQTTVSHAVATPERELGVRLLDRTGRTAMRQRGPFYGELEYAPDRQGKRPAPVAVATLLSFLSEHPLGHTGSRRHLRYFPSSRIGIA